MSASTSRPVNAYGSFLESNSDESLRSLSSESSNEDGSTIEERERCDCKGKCFRKKGKGACKCRENGSVCHDGCSCNKAMCKNKSEPEGERQTNAGAIQDGAEAFEQQRQHSRAEIQEFISNLDNLTKDRILCDLLNMGRGSLDFARTLAMEPTSNTDTPEDSNKPEWCKCGVCMEMQSEQENVCCKKRTCVTCYTAFSNICLDRDILEICIKARCDIRADDFNFVPESFRKAGYRQFALWVYGKLGRGNRRVLPACAVRRIRERYPAPDGIYMGYRMH